MKKIRRSKPVSDRWSVTGAIYCFTLVVCFEVILFSGCAGRDANNDPRAAAIFATNSAAIATISAGNFLRELQLYGRLPGFSKGEHGHIESDSFPLDEESTYPISRTFNIVKQGDPTFYYYTVMRTAEDDEWHLQKVWQTDSKGQIIKELPVKR